MDEFPELKEALCKWASDAVTRLLATENSQELSASLPHWQRDSDGIFRNRESVSEVWSRSVVDLLQQLPSWVEVEGILQSDSRLNFQINTLVGAMSSGRGRLEASHVGLCVLPSPTEVDSFDEAFAERYAKIEHFLAATEFESVVVWPISGLVSGDLPVQLDTSLELDTMSDWELGLALDAEIVRPMFPRVPIFDPRPEHRTCLRYRYRSPKVVGESDQGESSRIATKLEEDLQQIRASFEETLGLVLSKPVVVAGRFNALSEWTPMGGGISYQQTPLSLQARFLIVHLDGEQLSDLRNIWQWLQKPGLLQKHKGLALALRRISYQAQRERPEDELLDTMIAAEALYLSELGNEPYRGELRYRLSLRAAVWVDPDQVEFTRYEVLKLMQSAYDARSAIAHGGTPKPNNMKIRGEKVSLNDLVAAAKSVIAAGCRTALAKAVSEGEWLPDWDRLTLSLSGNTELGAEGRTLTQYAREAQLGSVDRVFQSSEDGPPSTAEAGSKESETKS
jgi:hypothetical protein